MGQLLVLAVAMGGMFATEARGGTVSVEYEIVSGGATSEYFGDGPVVSGKFRVKFQASGSLTVLSGPATLESFTVRAFRATALQGLEQTLQLALLAPIVGQGVPGSIFGGGGGTLSGYELLHCRAVTGTFCIYPTFVSSPYPPFSYRFFPSSAGIAITGSKGTARGLYETSAVGATGDLSLRFTGNEVSRTFVPEPHRAMLPAVLLTVLALRILAGVRRRSA